MVGTPSGKTSPIRTNVLVNPEWANVSGAKLEILIKEKGPTIAQVHSTIKKIDLVKG